MSRFPSALPHRRTLIAIFSSAALVFANAPGNANAAPSPGLKADTTSVDAPCDVHGFVIDTDPAGANLRSAPRLDAPLLARLAPPRLDREGNDEPTTVAIAGSHAGWLLVKDAKQVDAGRTTYAWREPGWISGGLVGFQAGSDTVYAAPSRSSAVKLRLTSPGYGPDSARIERTYGCRGNWVEVLVRKGGASLGPPVRGWLSYVCDLRLTTCG